MNEIKITKSELERNKVYSTVLYGDDRFRNTIYITAPNIVVAHDRFLEDYNVDKLRKKYNDYCHYSLSQLCENGTKLDTSEFQKFLDNDGYCLIFEEDHI